MSPASWPRRDEKTCLTAFEERLSMKLVVLSDLHIHHDCDEFLGINSSNRLDAAVEAINADYDDADLVIVNGDITHRRNVNGYRIAKVALDRLHCPLWLGLGNHDCRQGIAKVFGTDCLPGGYAQFSDRIGDYGVILLDTNGGGRSPDDQSVDVGHLCPQRMNWFRRQLWTFSDRPVIVVMHHTVLPLELTVDATCLAEAGPFLRAIKTHGNVPLVVSGHVHLNSTVRRAGTAFVTVSGGHFTTTAVHGALRDRREERTTGEGEFAVILGRPAQVTIHCVRYA